MIMFPREPAAASVACICKHGTREGNPGIVRNFSNLSIISLKENYETNK